MDRSDIKYITPLSSSSFYRKIIKKYQAGKKNTSRFPTMIFYKEKGYFFPKKSSMILKFRIHLDQQNIVPVLILKNIPVIEGRLPRLNTEKKTLQSILKLKDVQSTNNVTKISQAAFKIPRIYQIVSEFFLNGNIYKNKNSFFSYLKSLISRAGNIINNSTKILKSSFLPVCNAFYQQKARTISPDISTLDPKILNYENNMEILNSQIFGKKICYRLLNIARNPTFIDKEKTLKYWPMFEDKSPLNYLGKQNIIPSLIVKNIPVIKEIFSWLNTEKNGLQSLVKPKDAQNINDVANISQAAFKIPRMYQIASGILPTGHISTNKISVFSFILTPDPKIFNYKNNMEILNSQLIVKNIPVIKEIFSWLNTKKNGLQSLVKPKDTQNIDDVANISQVAFKIPQGYRVASEHFLTENISTNKASVFSFLKSLIFRSGNITNNSTKILNSSFLPVINAFYQQKTLTISPDILTLNPKILNYGNNMKILNSQIFGKKIYYRLLNIARNPTFIDNENTLKYWPVSEEKSPSNYLGKQNLVPSFIVKNIPVIKEIFSWLKTEKNGMQSLVNPKDAQNINDVANISQATFKIPRMYQIASGILPTGHISTNKISVFSVLKSLIFKAGNIVTNSNKILKPLSLSENAIYYQQAINSIYPGSAQDSSQILNYKNNVKILNSQVFRVNKNHGSLNITRHSAFINKKRILKNQPVFEDKLSTVLLQDSLLFNKIHGVNRRFIKKSNLATVNELLIKNYYGSFEHEIPSSVQSKHNYKMRHESLVFQDKGSIEQEIEQIKKIVIETKESVSEKTVPVFGEADIKKYLDINRISSQVYQNIERTIRMERERRGV